MPLSNCITATQAKLKDLTPYGYTRQPVGLLMAVLSAQNASRIKPQMLTNDGKTKKYQITYVAPDCSDILACDATGAKICDTGDSKPITTDTLTIDDCTPSGVIEMSVDDFRDLCNFNPSEFYLAQIQGKFDKVARGINSKLLTAISGEIGCFSTGNDDPRDIALINQTTGAPNWNADTEILMDFADAGLNVTPLLVGGRSIVKYGKGVENGMGTDSGVNISGMNSFPTFYDNQLQGVLGDAGKESFLALAPSIVNFVTYLDNVGQFGTNTNFTDALAKFQTESMYHHGIIQDPFTGLVFDMDAIYDTCTKTWKVSFRLKHDIWIMPITGCFSTACFNGILKYNACYDNSTKCVVNG